MGACCDEMDIWEANKISAAFTPHPCSKHGLDICESDTACGVGNDRYKGVCDKDGCDFNSYRMAMRASTAQARSSILTTRSPL